MDEMSRGLVTTRLNEETGGLTFIRRPEPKMRKEPYIVRTDQTAEAYAAKRVARAEGVGQGSTEYAGARRAGHG